ncbi:hypothetical protein [uncultured Ilyobacter sp.]|nr:hypothetical protein [uncultured Ilyobacter sp.]
MVYTVDEENKKLIFKIQYVFIKAMFIDNPTMIADKIRKQDTSISVKQ